MAVEQVRFTSGRSLTLSELPNSPGRKPAANCSVACAAVHSTSSSEASWQVGSDGQKMSLSHQKKPDGTDRLFCGAVSSPALLGALEVGPAPRSWGCCAWWYRSLTHQIPVPTPPSRS